MANAYSQLSLHIVFAVKHREALITPAFNKRLFSYIYGIIEGKKQKSLAVNGVSDHIHILAGVDHTVYIPDFVRDIKSDSSIFINERRLSPRHFNWQSGYGVFSHSRWERDRIIRYILNQEQHHQKNSFRKEYTRILKKMDVPFEDKYLFDFFE